MSVPHAEANRTVRQLVLASTSPYRRELLARLGLPFQTAAPEVDESRRADEPGHALAARLAVAKARAVAPRYPAALVVGSDQVAVNGDTLLGKPGDEATAVRQLLAASGRTVTFLTGLCVIDCVAETERVEVVAFEVQFRELTESEVRAYVARERPLDCAGAFKSEGLGVALFERMSGSDPTALVGLPLIRLCALLREAGLDPLAAAPV